MRHNPGIWNAIWSDMFIESTFMRYGHESGGLTWLTLKLSAVTGRIASDASYIDPFAKDSHPPAVLNIVTCLHATDKVNVDESLKIGRELMAEFDSGWPTSFNKTITKKVTMMASTKRASSWMESLCTIPNWSTPESYVSNSTGSRKHHLNFNTHNTSRAKSGPQCSLQQGATDRLDLPVSDEPHCRHPDKCCDHRKRS